MMPFVFVYVGLLFLLLPIVFVRSDATADYLINKLTYCMALSVVCFALFADTDFGFSIKLLAIAVLLCIMTFGAKEKQLK